MAIPFILWGAAAALAATGVVKGAKAVGNINDAKNIGESAESKHKSAIAKLDVTKELTNDKFIELGRLKVDVFTNQIAHVVDVLKKKKDASSQIKDFDVQFSIQELEQMEKMVAHSLELEKGILSGAAGGALAGFGAYSSVGLLATASTGTAISSLSGVAATNATLAWLGGGALSAGGFGMTGGMIALGGIVAGPALAIGGFILASKAEEALTKAHKYEAQVAEAIGKIELIEQSLIGLRSNASELMRTINELVGRFEYVKIDDPDDDEGLKKMLIIGKSIKEILMLDIIAKDGAPVPNIKAKCSGILAYKGVNNG